MSDHPRWLRFVRDWCIRPDPDLDPTYFDLHFLGKRELK